MPELSLAEWLMIAPTIIGVFSVVAKYTPTQADDRIVQALSDIVHVLGQNKALIKKKNPTDKPEAGQ